jgi:Trk K+ transport system NAD-binding subunit
MSTRLFDARERHHPIRGVITARIRKALLTILISAAAVVALAVVVFRYAMHLSWLDSFYFVVTMMTSVGFGDIHLRDTAPAIKLFGIFLMVIGPVALAAAFGIVADYILRSHLEAVFGLRRKKMHNHVIVCGLGNVGVRIIEHLKRLDVDVVGIEKNGESRFLVHARKMNVPVIIGDMRDGAVLEEAGLAKARGLVAACNEDVINLETGLLAREQRPELRVVLRLFDHNLAQRIQKGFGLKTAFSTSALAAPAFAMAAVDPRVVGSFYVDGNLMLNIEITVEKESQLENMTTESLRKQGDLSVLSHVDAKTGRRTLHPSNAIKLNAEDRIVVAASQEICGKLEALNYSPRKED